MTGLACGIVGLPNVGKSTLFNALTNAQVAAENYPFCTIEPNLGVVPVPDPRLDRLAALVKPEKTIPSFIQFVDIAGLVAGAASGEGLGNQFLSHIRETNAIAHVVRCFENAQVIHVNGKISPVSDIDTINTELALADLQALERQIAKYSKAAKAGSDKEAARMMVALNKIQAALDQGHGARQAALTAEEQLLVKPLCLLTMKPVMYIANVSDNGFIDNPLLEEVKKRAHHEKSPVVPIQVALESQISELSKEDQKVFLADLGLQETGLHRVIRAAANLLGLQTYFTAGPKEVRAWIIPAGATAPQAAGAIHSDFERGFIRAETIHYEDFIACGGEHGARESGKLRVEGKDYVVQDGDVLHFRFNV